VTYYLVAYREYLKDLSVSAHADKDAATAAAERTPALPRCLVRPTMTVRERTFSGAWIAMSSAIVPPMERPKR